MARIGMFNKIGDNYRGFICTINISISVDIKTLPVDNTSDYIVMHGIREIGRGWRRIDRHEVSYISLKIDDPAFPSPIYATLVKNGLSDDYDLEWSR